MGLAPCGSQRHRLRRLAACQRGQELQRQHLRRARHGRPVSVLGWQRATKDCGPDKQGGDPQEACRRHNVEAMNSVGVTQAYRSRLVAQQPKDVTPASPPSLTRVLPTAAAFLLSESQLSALLMSPIKTI